MSASGKSASTLAPTPPSLSSILRAVVRHRGVQTAIALWVVCAWLPIGIVTDKIDGKLAHLDGLNLSRAWMLEGIASGLPPAITGQVRRVELHWYEAHGIGRRDMKIKRYYP